jgi:hypothetical protein
MSKPQSRIMFLLVASLLIVAMVLGACGRSSPSAPAAEEAGPTIAEGESVAEAAPNRGNTRRRVGGQ